MLRIELKNGNVRKFHNDCYTDYDWRPEAFVVKDGEQWIAIFNWSEVVEVLSFEVDE